MRDERTPKDVCGEASYVGYNEVFFEAISGIIVLSACN